MSPSDSRQAQLTRKQRRERARAERRRLEQAQALRRLQRRRIAQLGGAAFAVAAIVALIALAASHGGSSSAPAPGSPTADRAASEVSALLQGIPQRASTLGAAHAPVTLQYFGDLECPVCREFTLTALPALIGRYVRPGKLRIEYRSLQTATRSPETFRAQQIAALAAGGQGKMWHYLELFYREQGEEDSGYVNERYLQGLAAQVPGLNVPAWTAERNDGSLADGLQADAQAAGRQGLQGTPSFLVGRTGGPMHELSYTSPTDSSAFEAAVEETLSG